MSLVIAPAAAVRGRLQVPGDKSISHRYAMLAALADGTSHISNYAPGADCHSTLACLAALGATIIHDAGTEGGIAITGVGLRGFTAPTAPLDCGNSGTTLRLLAGMLAAHDFTTMLEGDASLSRRPMRRVMTPLRQMGARFDAAEGDRPPLTIHGTTLTPIAYQPEVPSAQVKSAVLLAGIQTPGTTSVTEPASTRDHTEKALAAFGIAPRIDGRTVSVSGGRRLSARTLRVPGDISSAAFPAVAAAALPGSDVTISGVGLNPSRAAILNLLRRFGASVDAQVETSADGEPVGTIRVRHGELRFVDILPDEVPDVIDELPVLAALATFGGGMRVHGAGELRVKESDRISALVGGLRLMGADADEHPDGFTIRPTRRLRGGSVESHHDHRLAMAFAIAALGAEAPTTVNGADAVAVSYPSFFTELDALRS
ncbi:MAG: 3-phosphoshikimate 1-carboxyvinyltransferase [Acidobacteria bacterium]|nr:3-phosphoshikimate 1-carboxyvinyltransferase [Acidobacteriota bacterium]